MSISKLVNQNAANQLTPQFQQNFAQVKERFFSRNPEYWPVFAEPSFKRVIDFRNQHLAPADKLSAYPNGKSLKQSLLSQSVLPKTQSEQQGVMEMLTFTGALAKDWEHPSSVENVITMPCDPAIYGAMMGSLANPNLVYSEYAGIAAELEQTVIRQMANLAGYDAQHATGIFTQGGTFCNLYGYLLGLRKSLPEAKHNGMGRIPDYRIFNSQGGHYSNMTNLSLLGVDVQQKTLRIKVTDNNDIDLVDLENNMRACFQLKTVVPTIMLTMGTTDTFGVDKVKPVVDLRDRLCDEFEIEVKPHIHVDAAIGWSMIFFLDYDFASNPLGINAATLEGIQANMERFKELKYADSFTVDFQKWGYVPYTSSLVMIKNKSDMKALENDPDNFSYFDKELQGQTHLQSTIECSRGAAGLYGAYSALNFMGVEGYQTVLAQCLQNANYFRMKINNLPYAKTLAQENQGPSVGFKLYNPDWVKDPQQEFDYEKAAINQTEYKTRLDRNTQWHREQFLNRGKLGLFTNWVEFIARSNYDDKGRFGYIAGEKAVFMNPATTRNEIDLYIENIVKF